MVEQLHSLHSSSSYEAEVRVELCETLLMISAGRIANRPVRDKDFDGIGPAGQEV